MPTRSHFGLAVLLPFLLVTAASLLSGCGQSSSPTEKAATTEQAARLAQAAARRDAQTAQEWQQSTQALVDAQRQILVLLAEEERLTEAERAAANQVAHRLFHQAASRLAELRTSIEAALSTSEATLPAIDALLTQIESEPQWFDADRLAVRDVVVSIRQGLTKSQSLVAIRLHRRASEDLEAIQEIESAYDREMRAVFARFETRAIELKRERWDDYVAKIRTRFNREQILRDHAIVLPTATSPKVKPAPEYNGRELPPKTLLLTFDDGPHGTYTEEILAILKGFEAKAVFFQVGKLLGSVKPDGTPHLSPRADVSRRIIAEGHALANHSFSHPLLTQKDETDLTREIKDTDRLLTAIAPERSHLFRFPYGARSDSALQTLANASLKSMLWNIDSRDWADPIATSIADRVLREVRREGRGIVLFHDIHERTVKALPMILNELRAEGYQFATWKGDAPVVMARPATDDAKRSTPAAPAVGTDAYRNSWAFVIGINQYEHWPKLNHALQDADAIAEVLTLTLGFEAKRVLSLRDERATRAEILRTFRDLQSKVGPDDRVFVFFAGHGATRKLASGRNLGYIVPVEAKRDSLDSDAIAMTELQNIAEALPARHVFFVMDACYSGLGLTRGASDRYLRDNARRIGRQMLTAGGADQLVSDAGPGGHSIFTWTLLQALGGRADSNADGYLTATEIAAFVAPAVAATSQQTPAFGSLPGSQGGEFVFVRPRETEDLTLASAQLGSAAIRFNARLAVAPTTAHSIPQAKVEVPTLEGAKGTLVVPAGATREPRQLAEQANDVGLKLYREKRYAEAEQAFADALKLWSTYSQAANNLGFVYFKQGKHPEAKRWFEATIAMDPSRAVAHLNLADTLIALGETDRARKVLETYIAIAPHDSARRDGQNRLNNLAKPAKSS
jgi:peptidoglycan/xylan/chitin deacetylase (PgdA/CDA1 family)/uncharacterized caspase-like protein